MRQWQVIPAERRTSFAAVALDLRDEFTGRGITGGVNLTLDLLVGAEWRETDHKAIRNAGGVFLYTGLGKALDPVAVPQFRVRVRIAAQYYRPFFQATDDGLEFDVPTYNDANPPAFSPLTPETVLMWPRANYPFRADIRTIRGRVLNAGGTPMADALIEADGVERVMTDDSGGFTLPLRWQAAAGPVNVVVTHPRSGLAANPVFNLPGDLNGNQDITVV